MTGAGINALKTVPFSGADLGVISRSAVVFVGADSEALLSKMGGKFGLPPLSMGIVDGGKVAYHGALLDTATGGAKSIVDELFRVPEANTIHPSELGVLLGRGGNKDIFAFGKSDAIGVLRAGRNPQLIKDELKLLQQFDELGIPTVNARGPVRVGEQPGLLVDRLAQGSKDIVRLENGKVRIVGESPLLNGQSIADLQSIRNTMGNNKIQINDLQFLISNGGRVVVADPLAVNLNTLPSKNNLRMIDLLIQSARMNGTY